MMPEVYSRQTVNDIPVGYMHDKLDSNIIASKLLVESANEINVEATSKKD